MAKAKMFTCVDCTEEFRRGMEVETDFYLEADKSQQGGKRCVYCYNERTKHPVDPDWFIQVADRLEHEDEIIELADAYIPIPHKYYTNSDYGLTLYFEDTFMTRVKVERSYEMLKQVGFNVGPLVRSMCTINFSAPYEKHFTR